METQTLTVYSFDELPEEIQQNLIQKYRENNTNDFWKSERIASFRAAEEIYKDLHNIEENISGARLFAWLQNNVVYNHIHNNWISKHVDGKIKNCHYSHKYDCVKKKLSKVFFTNNFDNCPLTGVCYDYDFLQPVYDFLKNPSSNIDNTDLEIPSYESIAEKEWEYYNSDEFIIEELNNLDCQYTVDGREI
jgi:hypothetical protein